MDLLKAWAAGLVTAIAGIALTLTILITSAPVTLIDSLAGQVLAIYLPLFLVTGCTTAVAALAHPAPARHRQARHAVAVLAVPVALAVVELVNVMVEPPAETAGAKVLVVVLVAVGPGAVAGWQLVDRLRNRNERAMIPYGYRSN